MKKMFRGLIVVLACVLLLSGCKKEEELMYQAGAEVSQETEAALTERVAEATEAAVAVSVEKTTEKSTETIGYVYVCGAVNEPGVYPIYEDMRVCDAIAAAGGFSEEADQEWLNQAKTVSDGKRVYVYTMEETALMRAAGMTPEGVVTVAEEEGDASGGGDEAAVAVAESASDGLVNLNTASKDELMTLPGIGEAKAEAIIAYRNENGAFSSIEEIQNISGIKSGVYEKIKDYITV